VAEVPPQDYERLSAEELAAELRRQSWHPAVELLEELDRRPEAAPVLMRLVERERQSPNTEMAAMWAILLLSDYGAVEATDLVLATLRTSQDLRVISACGEFLARLDSSVLQPCLAIMSDADAAPAARSNAAWVAWQLATREEPQRNDEAIPVFRSVLRRELDADGDERLITALARGLVNLRDAESWPLLNEGFKKGKISELSVARSSARQLIKSSGRPRQPARMRWLNAYRFEVDEVGETMRLFEVDEHTAREALRVLRGRIRGDDVKWRL